MKTANPAELRETLGLMVSPNYKERFLAELLQLKIRMQKLNVFINKYI